LKDFIKSAEYTFNACFIGVEAGKFWGCEELGFLPKFPQTFPKQTPNKVTSIKTTTFPFLPKFSLTWPIRTKDKHDLQKKESKKRLHFHFGCHFCKIKAHAAICEGFHTFFSNFHRVCLDFKGFCLDFHQIKSFGGAFAPPASPPPTPVACLLLK